MRFKLVKWYKFIIISGNKTRVKVLRDSMFAISRVTQESTEGPQLSNHKAVLSTPQLSHVKVYDDLKRVPVYEAWSVDQALRGQVKIERVDVNNASIRKLKRVKCRYDVG